MESNDIQVSKFANLFRYKKKLFLSHLIFGFFFQIDNGLVGRGPEEKTLAVLLPCRERGSKLTKMWLRRLQQYLYYHYKNRDNTVYGCVT